MRSSRPEAEESRRTEVLPHNMQFLRTGQIRAQTKDSKTKPANSSSRTRRGSSPKQRKNLPGKKKPAAFHGRFAQLQDGFTLFPLPPLTLRLIGGHRHLAFIETKTRLPNTIS
jgi:hypothetical protein